MFRQKMQCITSHSHTTADNNLYRIILGPLPGWARRWPSVLDMSIDHTEALTNHDHPSTDSLRDGASIRGIILPKIKTKTM